MPDREEVTARRCFQEILNLQTPWGEWGETGTDHEERLKRVGRERALLQLEMFSKPNMFRTLLGMETVSRFAGDRFRHRIQRAFSWIDAKMKDGWFLAWMQGPRRMAEEPSVVMRIADVRHTAQAVLANIKFRRLTYETIRAIENLLNGQSSEGGWPDDLTDPTIGLFSTVYTTELLYSLSDEAVAKQLSDLGRDDIIMGVRPALDRARSWFFEDNKKHGGLWRTSYSTAMVIERIGNHLYVDYPELVRKSMFRLCDSRDGGVWVNEGVKDISMREQSRIPTTLRVCSALLSLNEKGIEIDHKLISNATDYLIKNFIPESLDMPDFAFMLKILSRGSVKWALNNGGQYEDYLSKDELLTDTQRKRVEEILMRWLEWSAARLEKLEPGMKLGLPDYSVAHAEEKQKTSQLLKTLARTSENKAIRDLAAVFARSSNSEQLLSNLRGMVKNDTARTLPKKVVDTLKVAAREVIYEIIPKVIAEMLKPQ